MRRSSLCLAAFIALALCAATTRAAFTTLLAPLAAACDAESAKLDGLNDKTSKKQRRLLDAISTDLTIERSDSVAGDADLLASAAKPLLKLFGVTYAPVADALAALTSRVRSDVAALRTRAGSVVDLKVKSKVGGLASKALATLDAIDPTKPFAQRIAKVRSAALAVESANQRIDAEAKCPKANPPGGHHGALRATIGDREFSSIYQSTSMVYDKDTNLLQRFVLSGTRVIGGQGDTVTIFIENAAFHGAGSYPADTADVTVLYEFPKGTFYELTNGTVEITSFDAQARDLRGTFSGTFVDAPDGVLEVEDAAFESCNWADSKTQ